MTFDPVGVGVDGPPQPTNQTKEQHPSPEEKREPKSVQSHAAPTGAPIRASSDAHTSGSTGEPITPPGDAHTAGPTGGSEVRGSGPPPYRGDRDPDPGDAQTAPGEEPDPARPRPLPASGKRKSTTPQRRRRKPCVAMTPVSAAAAVTRLDDHRHHPPSPSPRRPSSVISDAAAAELCDLRDYYSSQLRRIDHVSHEHLGGAGGGAGGGADVLACIREPLRSLRLPRSTAISRTARSLWTRVSSRRKLVDR